MQPYHKPIEVNGQRYTFEHLEPLDLIIESDKAKKALRVRVRFSNHCFTRKLNELLGDVFEPEIYDEGGKPRVFCDIRFRLSVELPDIVNTWADPNTKVHECKTERNWVYMMAIENPTGPYYVFFSIKRSSIKLQDLEVIIESAYHKDPEKEPPEVHGKMRFTLLCGLVYLRKPTSTAR